MILQYFKNLEWEESDDTKVISLPRTKHPTQLVTVKALGSLILLIPF